MTLDEIKSNLCYFDDRNPDGYNSLSRQEIENREKDCYCDNCFRGKTELAKELLRMYDIINGTKN